MNLKGLALTATLGLSTIFGGMAPAQAAPTLCWYNDNHTNEVFECDVTTLYHDGSVFDWVGHYFLIQELKGMVFLHNDGTFHVEPFDGSRHEYGTWRRDHEGDIQMKIDSSYWTFRIPR